MPTNTRKKRSGKKKQQQQPSEETTQSEQHEEQQQPALVARRSRSPIRRIDAIEQEQAAAMSTDNIISEEEKRRSQRQEQEQRLLEEQQVDIESLSPSNLSRSPSTQEAHSSDSASMTSESGVVKVTSSEIAVGKDTRNNKESGVGKESNKSSAASVGSGGSGGNSGGSGVKRSSNRNYGRRDSLGGESTHSKSSAATSGSYTGGGKAPKVYSMVRAKSPKYHRPIRTTNPNIPETAGVFNFDVPKEIISVPESSCNTLEEPLSPPAASPGLRGKVMVTEGDIPRRSMRGLMKEKQQQMQSVAATTAIPSSEVFGRPEVPDLSVNLMDHRKGVYQDDGSTSSMGSSRSQSSNRHNPLRRFKDKLFGKKKNTNAKIFDADHHPEDFVGDILKLQKKARKSGSGGDRKHLDPELAGPIKDESRHFSPHASLVASSKLILLCAVLFLVLVLCTGLGFVIQSSLVKNEARQKASAASVPYNNQDQQEINPKTGYACFETSDDLRAAVDLFLHVKYHDGVSEIEYKDMVQDVYGTIDEWCFGSHVTDLSHLFSVSRNKDATLFNEDISGWDVSRIEDMDSLFSGASSFNQPLYKWDTRNVKNMKKLFEKASKFNQAIGTWKTGNVIDISFLFDAASSFNQPIGDWDVSKVTDMEAAFRNAVSFNQSLEKWNVSNVLEMSGLFNNADAFNQPLNSWDVSRVQQMSALFLDADTFNQPLDQWNVSSAHVLRESFFRAAEFDQNLCSWGQILAAHHLQPHAIDTYFMFQSTSCASKDTPIVDKQPLGPFCAVCSNE